MRLRFAEPPIDNKLWIIIIGIAMGTNGKIYFIITAVLSADKFGRHACSDRAGEVPIETSRAVEYN